jgi:hypothetical protein
VLDLGVDDDHPNHRQGVRADAGGTAGAAPASAIVGHVVGTVVALDAGQDAAGANLADRD